MGHLTRVLRSIRSVSIGFVPSALSYRLVAYCRRASGTYRCMYIYGYAHWGGGGQKSLGLVEGLTINQLIFHVCRWFKLSSSVKTKQNFIYLAWCDYIRAFLLVSTYVIHINESTKNQNQNRLETLTRPTNLKPASLLPPPPKFGEWIKWKEIDMTRCDVFWNNKSFRSSGNLGNGLKKK